MVSERWELLADKDGVLTMYDVEGVNAPIRFNEQGISVPLAQIVELAESLEADGTVEPGA